MDWTAAFSALCDRLEHAQDAAFVTQHEVEVEGRTAARYSTYDSTAQRLLFGMMPTGNTSHAHEYRLLFAVPALDEAGLDDWWQYAQAVERALVRPDTHHEFSMVSLILAVGAVDRATCKKLKRLSGERSFADGKQGWSSIRVAVVDLAARKVYTNRMGDALKNVLKPLL